ncbi:hypothetical protein FSP39_005130, partial [Pinctada imbricata]
FTACSSDEFRCDSGQCVPQTSRCDRYTHCQDKSDEYNCPDCLGFQCTNGLCLWSFIVQCNGQVDCDDLSDEINCAPKINQRKCDNGIQISNNQWCDGVDNCYDNSDETNCSCNPVYEHQCTDITCIRQEWVCDGYTDCISDETNFHLLSINGTDGQKLQIFLKGQNYSVCSSNWTTEWSDIICRGLGHRPGAYNYTNTPNFIEVTLGSVERSRSVHNHSVKLSSDLIYHYPGLTWTGLGPIYWDIALVRLERPVKFTAYISPICLPSVNEIFSEADTCFLAGWGYLGYNQATTPQFLREAKLKIWNPNDCKTNTVAMETEVNTTFTLCAGYSSGILSGCQGDSGGPLMCLSSRKRWTLAGVMSSGSNVCGSQSNLANRFTKTSAVLNWIERIITMK